MTLPTVLQMIRPVHFVYRRPSRLTPTSRLSPPTDHPRTPPSPPLFIQVAWSLEPSMQYGASLCSSLEGTALGLLFLLCCLFTSADPFVARGHA